MTQYKRIRLAPCGRALGAQVSNLDLSLPLDAATRSELTRAHAEFGVLFFRNQKLTCEQHLLFARSLGEININRFFASVEGQPEIAEVCKEPEHTSNIGGGWHADHSYDEIPALGSILLAREVPPAGGDTVFASMYAAFDALSEGLKATLCGLRAVHSSGHVFGAQAKRPADLKDRLSHAELATQEALHPVVITHPLSGRQALYVNPGFTLRFDGWSRAESKSLLEYLYAHASEPEFTYRFRWQEGSIAFWDNRSTWHRALNDYPGQRRLMHRITLAGGPISG